jgi:hypothetical protein
MRRFLATVPVLLLAVACGTEPGTPTPETTSDASASTTASPRPTSSRPQEVRLDGKEPCGLLTAEQLASLKIDRAGKAVESDLYQTNGCIWTVTGASSRLVPVTGEGIEAWTEGKRTGQPKEVEPVLGFPAITLVMPSDEENCDILVDTADGQYLVATFLTSPSFKDRFPEPCAGARQLAEAAMQNLLK